MHPRNATGFEWDDGNRDELAQPHHPIQEWEAEEVFLNGPVWMPNRKRHSGDWKMVGRTDDGRALTLIANVNEKTGELRIITGWDATKADHTRYLSKRRGR